MFKFNFHFVACRYEIILALIVLFLTGSITVSSKDREPSPYPLQRYPLAIALTFDDGPHPYFTDKIISILQEYNAPSTFFVVGRMAMEYPHLVQHLAVAGHEVGGHTFTHCNLAKSPDRVIKRELSITRDMLRDITGKDCAFFRPPGGQYNERVVSVAAGIGQDMALWSVFPKDHEENDPAVIVQRVMEQAADGGVVLLHSGKPGTLRALPQIITNLRTKGYRFVTISQLRREEAGKTMAWYVQRRAQRI